MEKKNLCIIPARGESKRIPRKNIKIFLGKPIIVYSIEAAVKSKLFSEIMVSTDDAEIADLAKTSGAKVPFMRSMQNSDDIANILDVVVEVIKDYAKSGEIFDNICVIYPTAPLISINNLKEGYEALDIYDAALPVVEFNYPVWRSFSIENQTLKYQWPDFEKKRSQDLKPLYHDVGQWCWIKADKIIHTLVPTKTYPVILNSIAVQDIDNPSDWILAEMKYQLIQEV